MTTQIIRYMPRSTADYEQECSPKVLNPSRIEYHSNHDFYSALRAADLQSPPTFHGEHTKLCDEQGGMRDQYSYCLPISGRKDTPFCTNADRMNLLNVHSSKPICYASVLHMLLLDVYDELQATGNIPFLAFGSLLGAVRNQSMIPFTEDADIGYVGELITLEKLILALRRKGYHMFFMDIWRVCVAPTHPLVSHLYDANLPITKNYSVPYLDLYEIKKTDFGDWDLQELPVGVLNEEVCSPRVQNASMIEYHSGHRYYSTLKEMDPPTAPTFRGQHTDLCDEELRLNAKFSYCLPISGRKDTPFCTAGDRTDLLHVSSPKSVCYSSVLHMLLVEVYEELQASGNYPLITFGSLLGAVRNGSMIPFTEDTDIGFAGILNSKQVLQHELWQKGYHMFFLDIWRVCVAPTHPLASRLYDPSLPLTKYYSVPYVDLYQIRKLTNGFWDVQELQGSLVQQTTPSVQQTTPSVQQTPPSVQQTPPSVQQTPPRCTPRVLNVSDIQYHSGHRFYSVLKERGTPTAPIFRGNHTKLCEESRRTKMKYGFCLPIEGRKDTPFCLAGDRTDLLTISSPKSVCYASVLHMLLVDVYEELKATGNTPLITFGSLLGAVRNGSMIPFTEDTDIGYVGKLNTLQPLRRKLWDKGYHMFFLNIWRVCVAPTHPLASSLYEPTLPLTKDYTVPYVDLYKMKKLRNGNWEVAELEGSNGRFLPGHIVEPFSHVTINGMPFDTVHDPDFFLMEAYGPDYMTPKQRTEAPSNMTSSMANVTNNVDEKKN
ncbi:hypothetical protein PHMEG_0009849 [Phytophthora megakarya]|uniref:Uncharacterized protein n=1 Tax=Phytophthora megakarya TaxID=4795 RepID=A0A225WF59_9STRA|nr:hypothetical protein PHMEG_0009849 [Phytophthora megakarya]